jgi:hypothetical protein
MHIFNQITGSLLVVSFLIKAILHYLHDRESAKPTKRGSYYLTAFPIIDNYNSVYKPIVAVLVIYQYLMLTAALVQKREILLQLWNDWEKMP